jgi:hypothetical protein
MKFNFLQEALDALEKAVERRDYYDVVDIVMWIENDCEDNSITDKLLLDKIYQLLERLDRRLLISANKAKRKNKIK